MVTMKKIKKLYGGNICRQCINKTYKTHLVHTNCQYDQIYASLCPRCNEMKNIVTGFKLSGFLKLLFK